MKSALIRPYLLLPCLLAFVITPAHTAVTLVSDDFESLANGGARDASGKYSTGTTASVWWYENTSGLTTSATTGSTPTGNFSGNYLRTNFANGSGPNNMGVVPFSSVTLGVGDNLSVQFDFRYQSTPASYDRSPQFGFYNGTQPTADISGGTSAITAGYNVSFADASPDTATLYKDTTAFWAGGGGNLGTVNMSSPLDTAVSGAYTATFKLAIGRTATNTLIFNVYLDGTLINSFSDTSATNFTFNEFAIRARNTGDIDNFVITSSVPEPSAYALLPLSVGLLLLLNSRRRHPTPLA